eukprot:8463592-Pyramimonas_sp.AAC.1
MAAATWPSIRYSHRAPRLADFRDRQRMAASAARSFPTSMRAHFTRGHAMLRTARMRHAIGVKARAGPTSRAAGQPAVRPS